MFEQRVLRMPIEAAVAHTNRISYVIFEIVHC